MILNQIRSQSSRKCTMMSNCLCNICIKQNQILQILSVKQQLQWFGKKKQEHSNKMPKQLSFEFVNTQQRIKGNRKNESQNFGINKTQIESSSSYIQNYNKKDASKPNICQPKGNLAFQKSPIDQLNYLNHDIFNFQQMKIQKEVPIKRIEQQFDLPFLGKSSYNQHYSYHVTKRTNQQRPRDSFKTLDVQIGKQKKSFSNDLLSNSCKHKQFYRPPSPFKRKGHMLKSNSFSNAYDTLYNNSFKNKTKEEGQSFSNSCLNPERIKALKFGSLSKARWYKSKQEKQRQNSIDLYK